MSGVKNTPMSGHCTCMRWNEEAEEEFEIYNQEKSQKADRNIIMAASS